MGDTSSLFHSRRIGATLKLSCLPPNRTAAAEEMRMSLASLGPMGRKGRPSLYRMALVAGFLSLNAVFWYLAIKAIAFLGLLATL